MVPRGCRYTITFDYGPPRLFCGNYDTLMYAASPKDKMENTYMWYLFFRMPRCNRVAIKIYIKKKKKDIQKKKKNKDNGRL